MDGWVRLWHGCDFECVAVNLSGWMEYGVNAKREWERGRESEREVFHVTRLPAPGMWKLTDDDWTKLFTVNHMLLA